MSSSSFLPVSFRLFLQGKNPVYSNLPYNMQFALARVFYGALSNQQPHKFGDEDLFTIFSVSKQRLFGSAEKFNEANFRLNWFAVEMLERVGSHARGYVLTETARGLGEAYLEQSLKSLPEPLGVADRRMEDGEGRPFRRPPNAIRSKTATGANSVRFKGNTLKSVIPIDGDAVREFVEVACAWQRKERCAAGWEWLYRVWDELTDNPVRILGTGFNSKRVQRAKAQALIMLDVAKRFGAPGYALPSSYIESEQGRLYAEGPINLQGCVRELRWAALRGCYDIDIENCHWALLSQLASREDVEIPHIQRYLDNKRPFRRRLASDLEISIDDAKFVLLSLVYGARLAGPKSFYKGAIQERIGGYALINAASYRPLLDLQDDIEKVRKAVLALPKFTKRKPGYIVNDADHELKLGTKTANKQLAHILQGAESQILRVCMESVADIIVIHHYGFTCRNEVDTVALSKTVEERTGYRVEFSHKRL